MTINYTEKGLGLHKAIRDAGFSLSQVDGKWISSNDEAVQAIIDAYDPLPLAKDNKWRDIQVARDAKIAGGVRVGDHLYHSDSQSRIQQLGLVMMGQAIPPGLMWKTIGGSFVEMNPALAKGIFAAIAQSDTAIFAAAEVHKSQVWALTDAAEVEAYDFTSGWPPV